MNNENSNPNAVFTLGIDYGDSNSDSSVHENFVQLPAKKVSKTVTDNGHSFTLKRQNKTYKIY